MATITDQEKPAAEAPQFPELPEEGRTLLFQGGELDTGWRIGAEKKKQVKRYEGLCVEAERKLAEMQIAQARTDQAKAKLEILKNRLEQSQLRAPFDGVVVEGDLRERVGAPLKQGDALFRVAHLERMFAEVLVAEADVRHIVPGAKAEVAFASQPGRRFPVVVERIEPLAQSRPEGNVFLVRCTLPAEMEAWWRPGMSGAAKIEAGRRTPLWQATHRTLDYLRLRWW